MDDSKIPQEQPDSGINQTTQQSEASPLDICQKELQQTKERYAYLQAELDNYKKRVDKERALWMETAQDAVVSDILPLVDDMDRALEGLQSVPQELQVHVAGFEMISRALAKLLKKYDIEEIPFSKTFDPEYFEAVMQTPADNTSSGDIVTILQKGYQRKGRVLRPAKVSVAA